MEITATMLTKFLVDDAKNTTKIPKQVRMMLISSISHP